MALIFGIYAFIVIYLAYRGITDGFLRMLVGIRIGSWRSFAPNMLTLWGLLIWALSIPLFFYSYFTGLALLLFSFMCDVLDGRVARATGKTAPADLSLWQTLNFPGITSLGSSLDPFVDKIKILPLLCAFAWMGRASVLLVTVIVTFDCLGTIMRAFACLSRFLKGKSATWVGKTKVAIQIVSIFFCAVQYVQWVGAYGFAEFTIILLSAALLFAIWSVHSKIDYKKLRAVEAS